jgi:TonB-dependent receptor
MPSILPSLRAAARLLAVLFSCGAAVLGAATATITGTVSNAATGNLLPGARVEIATLRLAATADQTGRFALPGVPVGEHEVTVSYTGLDAGRQTVRIAPDAAAPAPLSFALTSSIYQLDKFIAYGPREGSASAITEQRIATNFKNVVAMDSFGNLPNLSAGEVAIRLPGVGAGLDDEGNVTGLIIRGQPAINNRIVVDGELIANTANLSRQFQTHSMTGAMFDRLEVIKTHTPDKSADSVGGTINLITPSPLTMREKRRVRYNVSMRVAPSFTDQVALRRAHRAHPLLNASYQEAFDAFGGERNLGVAANVFYSENVAGGFRTIRDYQNTTAQPAYLYTWANQDYFNSRKQGSANLKFEYRLSPGSRVWVSGIYNDAFEPFNRLYETTVLTAQSVAALDAAGNPTGTGAILPNFSNTLTEARALAGSIVRVNETMFSFYNRTRIAHAGGTHEFGPLTLEWNANFSRARANLGVGGGGTLTLDNAGVGWRLDRSKSDLYPAFTQTSGPDYRNIANYRPNGFLSARRNTRLSEVSGAHADATYKLPLQFNAKLKAGLGTREQISGVTNNDQRWSYAGGTRPFVADPSIVTWLSERTGFAPPLVETAALIRGYQPVEATLWTEDNYFRESQKFIGNRQLTETVDSGYVMTSGKAGGFGFLAGVREERTKVESFGYVRARSLSTAAQQIADPVGTAQRDYANNARRINRSYTDNFPSAHFSYDLTKSLKARLAWSTSFGRPPPTNLLPSETANETAQVITIANPGLLPQKAREWDAALEYYFEPVGLLSVGWFKKNIRDYIVNGINAGRVGTGTDNGFNGDYAGFDILQTGNLGSADVTGWEFSYQQQFTFLPGLLRTLGFSANYTYLRADGNYGGAVTVGRNQVAGFIPQMGNANLSWRYKALGARVRANYHGRYLNASGGLTAPQRNQYRFARTVTDLGFTWQLRRGVQLSLDISNLTNEPQQFYRYNTSQMERTILNGTTWTLGVSGRF